MFLPGNRAVLRGGVVRYSCLPPAVPFSLCTLWVAGRVAHVGERAVALVTEHLKEELHRLQHALALQRQQQHQELTPAHRFTELAQPARVEGEL